MNQESWLNIRGKDAPDIAEALEQSVNAKVAAGKFRREDIEYIARIDRQLVKGTLDVSDSRLEKLRRLCQLWEVDLKAGEITSHRRIIGPFIVAFKKLLLPMVRVLFKDTLRQQRDFNAATISLLTELSQEKKANSSRT
jgi:hypothetical protein